MSALLRENLDSLERQAAAVTAKLELALAEAAAFAGAKRLPRSAALSSLPSQPADPTPPPAASEAQRREDLSSYCLNAMPRMRDEEPDTGGGTGSGAETDSPRARAALTETEMRWIRLLVFVAIGTGLLLAAGALAAIGIEVATGGRGLLLPALFSFGRSGLTGLAFLLFGLALRLRLREECQPARSR